MSFSKISFTNAGRALQAKALAGTPLVFTKIALGSGSLNGRDPATFTSLLELKVSLSISKTTRDGQQVMLEANFSNQDNNTGFYWREVGLFANDPTLGEILYCYGNAGNVAEYIQPSTSSSIEKVITLTAVVGNAQNVTAIINTAAFATKKDISAMTMSLSEVNSKLAQVENEKATKLEVEIERQRTNQILANPGSTSGDLALNDIKVGADGIVYNSPGDALRTQITNLNLGLKNGIAYTSNKKTITGKDVLIQDCLNGTEITYSNNCLITGLNLFNPICVENRTNKGITTKVETDGTITISGTATETDRYISSEYINILLPAGNYKVYPSNLVLVTTTGSALSGDFTLSKPVNIKDAYFKFIVGQLYNENIKVGLIYGTNDYCPYLEMKKENGKTYSTSEVLFCRSSDGNNIEVSYFQKTNFGQKTIINKHVKDDLNTSLNLKKMSSYKISSGSDITINIPNNTGSIINNGVAILNLHNYDVDNNISKIDIYSSSLGKDFQGIKFFDSENELTYNFKSVTNCKIKKDTRINSGGYKILSNSDGAIICQAPTTMVGYAMSKDGGATWTSVFDRGYIDLIGIDSNDNIYAIGIGTYCLYRWTKADNYKVSSMVLDLSSLKTISGEIAETDNGYLYFGNYQESWQANLYRSKDKGLTWELIQSKTDKQHTHSISVDRTVIPNVIYWGVDDSKSDYGASLFASSDYGDTFTEVNVPYRNRDYFVYHSNNVHIGGGECNILGGVTLYKTSDVYKQNLYYTVLDTKQGIRNVFSIKGDKVLGCLATAGGTNQTRTIFLSEDYGETWKPIYEAYPEFTSNAGNGYRWYSKNINNKIYMSGYGEQYACVLEYGTEEQTAVVHVNVGNIPVGGKDITLKTGYLTNYEETTNREFDDGLVFNLDFTNGEYIEEKISHKRIPCDLIPITQDDNTIYTPNTIYNPINLGSFTKLNFTKNFTLTFWLKCEKKSAGEVYADETLYEIMTFASTGTVPPVRFFVKKNHLLVISDNYANPMIDVMLGWQSFYNPGINFYAVVFKDGKVSSYSYDIENVSDLNISENIHVLLNTCNCTIGSRNNIGTQNVSAKHHLINDIRIYNKILNKDEIRAIWKKEYFTR